MFLFCLISSNALKLRLYTSEITLNVYLCSFHLVFHYEIGGHDRGRPRPAHDTVDNNQTAALDSLVNEGGGGGEISEKQLANIRYAMTLLQVPGDV